jgi:hypothetical protein
MPNRFLAIAIVCALLTVTLPLSASAKSTPEKDAVFTEKVKAGVAKLGVGPEARVEVKLRNKTKLSGFISDATENSFVITAKNGTNTVIAYTDVGQVKGNNLNTGTKIILIGAIVAGALAILYFAAFKGKHF